MLGLLYGLLRLDWVIIISLGLLTLLVGFPKESNGVLRLALEPVFASRFEEKERLILQTIQSSASHDYYKQLKGYKQLSEMQPDNDSYKLKVDKLTKLMEQEKLAKIKAQRAAEARSEKQKLAKLKVQYAAEARSEKQKLAKIKAQRAAEAKRKKEARRKALRDTKLEKQRVAKKIESFKLSLHKSKWTGDLFVVNRNQKQPTYYKATLRCDKKIICDFNASSNSTLQHDRTFNFSLANLLTSGEKVKLTPRFSSKGSLKLNISNMPLITTQFSNNSKWNPNGKWVGELKSDKMLVLWHGNETLELKRRPY